MIDNENLLNDLYQNVQMVLETLPQIRKSTKDCDFQALLDQQEAAYHEQEEAIQQAIREQGFHAEDAGEILKTYSEWMTKLKAIRDSSTSHLAEMCIQGYTMGMIQSIQSWHKYCNASKQTLSMAKHLSCFHQGSIESLKKYL